MTADLTEAPRTGLASMGIPVRHGCLTLGRLRELLSGGGSLELVAGFGVACWVGPTGVRAPDLGRLT